jgi:hypothetical protein
MIIVHILFRMVRRAFNKHFKYVCEIFHITVVYIQVIVPRGLSLNPAMYVKLERILRYICDYLVM